MTAASVDLAAFGVAVTTSTESGVSVLGEELDAFAPVAGSVETGVFEPSVAPVPSVSSGVPSLVEGVEPAVVEGGGGVMSASVTARLDPVALVVDEERGAGADCLLDWRLRADPAEPAVRLGLEALPESFAELAFGPESAEPPSVAAAATP
ncbi:hypothetical protein ACRDU6_19970 [Mycolicibacterium sp. ELW1]|uniref:hypothetical protein n=1 Tax=Mycobacteriaceae TaxID=1762 RepID=UPI0011F03B5E|nr:hypothetical protein [Mycobacterium sp. ELW1]QEN14645.1 hypothetical protein D3H54_16510 [Mycobacterium sp. ELW1]